MKKILLIALAGIVLLGSQAFAKGIYISIMLKKDYRTQIWYGVAATDKNYRFGWTTSEAAVSYMILGKKSYIMDDFRYTYVEYKDKFDPSVFDMSGIGGALKDLVDQSVSINAFKKTGSEVYNGFKCDVYTGKDNSGQDLTLYFTKEKNVSGFIKQWKKVKIKMFKEIGLSMMYIDKKRGLLVGVRDNFGSAIDITISDQGVDYLFSMDGYKKAQ